MDTFTTACKYLGAVTAGCLLLKAIQTLSDLLRPSTLPKYNHHDSGNPGPAWALVTGATDGIGYGFAQELCHQGFNVILHGRNRAKLLQRQSELLSAFPTAKTKLLVYDAANLGPDIDAAILQEINGLNLTILVNNLGGTAGIDDDFSPLDQMTYGQVEALMTLNASFLAQITRVVLPVLKRNQPGLVLNISSAASYGFAYLTVYSGSKGFVESFTRAVQAELSISGGAGVEVMGIVVGSVQSAGNHVSRTSLFTPSARAMATAALGRVGCAGGPVVWGYLPHAVQGWMFSILPRSIIIRTASEKLEEIKQASAEKGKKSI